MRPFYQRSVGLSREKSLPHEPLVCQPDADVRGVPGLARERAAEPLCVGLYVRLQPLLAPRGQRADEDDAPMIRDAEVVGRRGGLPPRRAPEVLDEAGP